MEKLIVTPNEAGQRLDKLLTKYLNQAGRGFLYKMMRKKNITLNRKKCDGSERLREGDEICLFLSEDTIEKFSGAQNAGQKEKRARHFEKKSPDIDILYEDDHILLVNKPAGLLSQKAKEDDYSLNEQIRDYLLNSGRLTARQLRTFQPSVCNRLDRNTSGIVTAGISLPGLQVMNQAFRDRSIHKYYQCLVKGKVKERQKITGFLEKDERRNTVFVSQKETGHSAPIVTEYAPVGGNEKITLLEVKLITGKSHQIRAHLASIGHPLLGDHKYGDQALNKKLKQRYQVQSQLLHSWRLIMPKSLPEPLTYLEEKEFLAPLPGLFRTVMEGEGIVCKG